jgi:hypothetical protein
LDCDARAAYLAPEEFASPGYSAHFEDLGVPPVLLRGLFYTAPSTLDTKLAERVRGQRVIVVYGGSGAAWDDSVDKVIKWAPTSPHAVLVRRGKRLWRLYGSGHNGGDVPDPTDDA